MRTSRVTVKFQGTYGKEYCYLTDIDLKPGDIAVVQAPDGEFKLVKVQDTCGISPYLANKAHKWIVDRVDTDAFLEREKERRKIIEIKNRLKARREQYDEMIIYERMAEEDPEAKKLLDELKGLSKKQISL